MRILIVEDEVKIREGIARLISRQAQYAIIGKVKNGKEGIEFSLRYKPDLIITDIRMPVMDGLEMLTQLQKAKLFSRAIILTGYSEFEYAKKAISLGVKNYLLKPISPEEVIELLHQIDAEIKEENKMLQGSCESIIRDIILGSSEEEATSYAKLADLIELEGDCNYRLYVGYIGSAPVEYKNHFKEWMLSIIERYPECKCYTFFVETLQQFVCLVVGKEELCEWEAYFIRYMIKPYRKQSDQPAWAAEYFNSLEMLGKTFQTLEQLLSFSLTYGNDNLLKQDVLMHMELKKPSYPVKIENQFKVAICKGELEKLSSLAEAFYEYCAKSLMSPEDIRNYYIKMVTFITNIVQEIDLKLYEHIQNMSLLKHMSGVYTRNELEQLFSDLLTTLQKRYEKKEDIRNYTILKVISYIRDHYSEGITLEEVARKMDLTPEYLSTLFNKEMDINFSNFLKQFRMSHAKRLLKGTDLKIYEIAEAVGYSDAKYFMRVFKEVQGMSPKEFRQKQ